MFAIPKLCFTLPLLSCLILLVHSHTAQAAPPPLHDFHQNCDIRQLDLSQEQHNNLRRIRLEYKQAADKAHRKAVRSDRTRRQNIIKILSANSFDQNAARDYVENRYLSGMDFAVEELDIQYRFYRLLNERQRQLWLENCLR